VLAAVVVLQVMVPLQAAKAAPARSGTIIGGYFPFAPLLSPGPQGCEWTVECRAWLLSGCDPSIAGRDPGLHASIVDVRKLARSKTRTLRLHKPLPGIVWGGVTVQLWSRDCTEIWRIGGDFRGVFDARFKIRAGSVWMTVASTDNTTLTWELS
jgi:hypothetical protein